MTLNIKPSTVYPVGDKTFTDRKEAVAYGKVLQRTENLQKLDFTKTGHAFRDDDGGGVDMLVSVADIPALIASMGDSIQEALAVKQFERKKVAA